MGALLGRPSGVVVEDDEVPEPGERVEPHGMAIDSIKGEFFSRFAAPCSSQLEPEARLPLPRESEMSLAAHQSTIAVQSRCSRVPDIIKLPHKSHKRHAMLFLAAYGLPHACIALIPSLSRLTSFLPYVSQL